MIMIIINLFLYLELDHKNISIFYRIDKITSKKRLIVIGDWAMGDRAIWWLQSYQELLCLVAGDCSNDLYIFGFEEEIREYLSKKS